jgi:hypothetical protein
MDKLRIGDWLIGILYVSAIFVLVRPGSQGPKLVDSLTKGTTSLVNAATGGGGWAAK